MARMGFLVVLLALPVGTLRAQTVTARELNVYLLAGQSNMAGRGAVSAEDTTRHPRVYALGDSLTWRLAYEPLHFDKPGIVGVGPGFAFGKAMADADSNVVIGLIPAAVGGSAIESWRPGEIHGQTHSRPYDDAVSRTVRVLAEHGGTLRGIIWHQGEANRQTPPVEYRANLVALIARFRADFGIPDLPFVAARLAPYFVENHPGADSINAVISEIPALVDHTAVVDTDDLVDKGDGVHLDASSARLLGRRFARAMMELQKERE